MNEEIKKLIKLKRPDMDDRTLKYFANYFSVVAKDELLPDEVNIESIIDNTLSIADKIEFYTEEDEEYKSLGPDIKGLCDIPNKTLYIRGNLPEPLREIIVYHEIHHAAQTNIKTGNVGVNQYSNVGRMIMEAQTQYMAEKVYTEIHGFDFETKEYPTERLRMLKGGMINSSLHNYQMYDNLLTKLAIMLNVSKDYFVTINYQYEDGLRDLMNKYIEASNKYEFPKDFHSVLFDLDYIYVVDYMAYLENPDKKTILNGEETTDIYEIHPGMYMKLSLGEQQKRITYFDRENFLALLSNGGNYSEFAKYIIDNKNKQLVMEFVSDKQLDVFHN